MLYIFQINAPKTPQNTKSTRRKSEAESRSPKSDDEVSEDDLSLLERLDRSRPNWNSQCKFFNDIVFSIEALLDVEF